MRSPGNSPTCALLDMMVVAETTTDPGVHCAVYRSRLQWRECHLCRRDAAAGVARVFAPLIPGEVRPRGSQGVALDGKAQRGRLRHGATPTHPIHAVSAFCHDLGGVLAQLVVDAQQHQAELTVAPEIIRRL